MHDTAGDTRAIEAELSETFKYIDLYVRQKIDLYMQHYVLDPFDFFVRQIVYLSVLAALLVSGTVALAIGMVLYVSTLMPLWQALLILGIVIFVIAGIIAYVLFTSYFVSSTPKTSEMIEREKAFARD